MPQSKMSESFKATLFSRSRDRVTVKRRNVSGNAEQFRALCAPLFEISPLLGDADKASRHYSGQLYFLEGFVFCRFVSGGAAIRRTRKHIVQSGRLLAFLRLKRGKLLGACDQVPFNAHPDQLALHDYSRPFSALLSPSIIEVIYVPKACLWGAALTTHALPSFHLLDKVADPFSSICAEIMAKLQFSPDTVSRQDLQLLNLSAQAMVCEGGEDVSVFRAERAELVRDIMAFIERNLALHDLCAAMLLAEFGVSRATLFRLFEAFGGVRTYILERRLFRALLEIAEHPNQRGQIQQAVDRWGFSSATHFHRAVKRTFGAAPGALFSSALKDPANGNGKNWMATLKASLATS